MADLIGGSLSEIEHLGVTSQRVGDDAGAVFADVEGRTSAFTGDIEEMSQRLESDFREFTERVESEAARLATEAGGTNWAGLSGAATRDRIEAIHADARAFGGRAMEDVAGFRAHLQQLVQDHYDHIATDMGAVIEQMQDVHRSEAEHAARYAQAARELDEAAAHG